MLIISNESGYHRISMRAKPSLIFILVHFLFCSLLSAQILPREDQQVDAGLEDLYDKYENEENKLLEKQRSEEKKSENAIEEPPADIEVNKLSELSMLSPFENIAVIQKRFLPKTMRLEMSGNGLISTNSAYFNNIGIGARLGFYFDEKYGLEAGYQVVTSSQRPITEGLVDNQRIKTSALVEPESYYGLAFKWAPVYGKIAWFQEKIIPFDLYFTPGFGFSKTTHGGSEPTFTLGLGQLFALTKSVGVRWDFYWNNYKAKITVDGVSQTQNHNDLFLGIGLSYFIPEATYR